VIPGSRNDIPPSHLTQAAARRIGTSKSRRHCKIPGQARDDGSRFPMMTYPLLSFPRKRESRKGIGSSGIPIRQPSIRWGAACTEMTGINSWMAR